MDGKRAIGNISPSRNEPRGHLIYRSTLILALALAAFPTWAARSLPLMLGQPTPAGACRDPGDCVFALGAVRYVSFDRVITRREVCVPADRLFDAALKGDRLAVVRERLQRSGWAHIVASKDGDRWTLSAVSKSDEFKWIEVAFDRQGRVSCVTEALLSV